MVGMLRNTLLHQVAKVVIRMLNDSEYNIGPSRPFYRGVKCVKEKGFPGQIEKFEPG